MRSDEEMERLLENWLEDEARPMPREVLESALEAVSRAAQVGRSGPLARWGVGARFLTAGIAGAAVVLAVLAGPYLIDRTRDLQGFLGGSPQERVWDPAAEFRRAPHNLNPSPDHYGNASVWSYLSSTTQAHEPAMYLPLPDFIVNWNERDLVNLFVGVAQEEGLIHMHPWSDGTLRRNAILGWTSPVSGRISIEGGVGRAQSSCDVSTGGIDFSIDQGAVTLRTITLLLGQSADLDLTTTVATGETLYFIVDAGPDARCDLTYLGLRIFFPAHEHP